MVACRGSNDTAPKRGETDMKPETIFSHPPRVLSQAEREFFFTEGYLCLPAAIDVAWLDRLRTGIYELVERSRSRPREPGHATSAYHRGRSSRTKSECPRGSPTAPSRFAR
jgi:hypothetical protein